MFSVLLNRYSLDHNISLGCLTPPHPRGRFHCEARGDGGWQTWNRLTVRSSRTTIYTPSKKTKKCIIAYRSNSEPKIIIMMYSVWKDGEENPRRRRGEKSGYFAPPKRPSFAGPWMERKKGGKKELDGVRGGGTDANFLRRCFEPRRTSAVQLMLVFSTPIDKPQLIASFGQ